MVTEREASRAARSLLEQFNEHEHSDAMMLLISWMEADDWDAIRSCRVDEQTREQIRSTRGQLADHW